MTPRVARACIGFLLLVAWSATAAAAGLPQNPSELLLVGDSVTAGIYFLSLSETSIRQSWAGQLMTRLGFDPTWNRFHKPYPIDHLGLARRGFSLGGIAYPWQALPLLLPGSRRFEAREERVVMAVPGQMLREVLEQSSKNKGRNSSGWTFARMLLPKGLSVVETIEQWPKRPRWVVLFIGANDLLATFGIVGDAAPPSPKAFRRDYERLVVRLRGVMHADSPPDHLLVLTLPDVTRLPMLQPLAGGAVDGRGRGFPAGSMTSAFLVPFRNRFEPAEVWTPPELERVRKRVKDYNKAIKNIADKQRLTLVDLKVVMDELGQDPSFGSPSSPYFSPDLHHPSFRTHRRIAGAVLDAMAGVARVPPPSEPVVTEAPLPHNGDFSPGERARVDAMLHLGIQGLRIGPLPPKPSYRLSVQVGGQGAKRRAGSLALSVAAGIESLPSPVTTRWLSRGGLYLLASPVVFDTERNDDFEWFPDTSLEARAGIGLERIGAWNWSRLGAGVLYAVEGGVGWYVRGEWQMLYADVSSRGGDPDRLEAGMRWGWFVGRPGRNGN